MKPEEEEYAKLRLARAWETLVEADLLLTSGHLYGAVNRMYYACFYAANALLIRDGLSSSKHSGVISLFDRHWMKTGRLPAEMGKFYRQLFEVRQEGDYRENAHFEQDEVQEWLSQARSFVETVANWLRSNAGIET